MVSLGRRIWLKGVYTKPFSYSKKGQCALWMVLDSKRMNLFVRSYTDFKKGNVTRSVSRDMGRSNRRVIPLGPITARPMHQPAGVVANTLCCKPSCSPCRRRRYRKCAVRDSKDSIVAPVYYFISLSLPPPWLSGPTNPDLPSQVSLHFGSRAYKIDRATDGS